MEKNGVGDGIKGHPQEDEDGEWSRVNRYKEIISYFSKSRFCTLMVMETIVELLIQIHVD